LAYGRRIECVRDFCSSTRLPLHAEELLEFALIRNRVRIGTVGWRASRVRLGGVVREEDFERPYDPRWSARVGRLIERIIGRV